MTTFSLSARLRLGANSDLALSLPQSRCFNPFSPRQLCPLAVLRSCFGYSLSHLRTAAACLSRCIRHWRRSKAKPLRGSRGGFAASHRIAKVKVEVKPAEGGLPSSVTVQRKSAAPCHLPQGEGLAAPPQVRSSPKCKPQSFISVILKCKKVRGKARTFAFIVRLFA